MSTLTLTDFLLARIAEDEEEARCERPLLEADSDFVAKWRPRRVLDECKAKRRIVDDLRGHHRFVLRALAIPYADHPDYREEWRP